MGKYPVVDGLPRGAYTLSAAPSGKPDVVLIATGSEVPTIMEAQEALGRQISEDYKGQEPVLVGVLRGVVCFMADLLRQISLPTAVEFMAISAYTEDGEHQVRVTKDLGLDIEGRAVILVEDIVDTGMTLRYLMSYIWSKRPASVVVCTLLDKAVRRLVDVPVKYRGFEVPDEFVVGYGLDYQEQYRNLPFIGVLKPVEPKQVAQR